MGGPLARRRNLVRVHSVQPFDASLSRKEFTQCDDLHEFSQPRLSDLFVAEKAASPEFFHVSTGVVTIDDRMTSQCADSPECDAIQFPQPAT